MEKRNKPIVAVDIKTGRKWWYHSMDEASKKIGLSKIEIMRALTTGKIASSWKFIDPLGNSSTQKKSVPIKSSSPKDQELTSINPSNEGSSASFSSLPGPNSTSNSYPNSKSVLVKLADSTCSNEELLNKPIKDIELQSLSYLKGKLETIGIKTLSDLLTNTDCDIQNEYRNGITANIQLAADGLHYDATIIKVVKIKGSISSITFDRIEDIKMNLPKGAAGTQRLLATPLCCFGLSARTLNVLSNAMILYVEDLVSKQASEVRDVKGLGEGCYKEIVALLFRLNLTFGMDINQMLGIPPPPKASQPDTIDLPYSSIKIRQLLLSAIDPAMVSTRCRNRLNLSGIYTYADLVTCSRYDLQYNKNFSNTVLYELDDLLKKFDLYYKMDVSKYGIYLKPENGKK